HPLAAPLASLRLSPAWCDAGTLPVAGARRRDDEDQGVARQIPGLLRRLLPQAVVALAGQLLLARRQEGDRPGHHRRPLRAGAGTVDRLPGGVDDGTRLPRRIRASRQLAVRVAPAVRAVRASVHQLPPPVLAAAPGPAGAAVVLGLAGVLRSRAHQRLGAAAISP